MPKGEKVIGPKQKDRTTTLFSKNCFLFQIICKNPLDSKEENLFRGSFYLAKGKAFETGGEFSKT
jgi:hypothetical protein